ncbi:MAG: hypothetical protein WA625_02735 [Pseudolabrys sp.]|jgi:hypothetical protein
MFRLVPSDVWAAVALAVAIALVASFDPITAIFVGACFALFVYVVVETFGGKLS